MKLKLLIHNLGMASIGGSIFLQILVFSDIIQHGYFLAIEHNPFILGFESSLAVFALLYFAYLYQRFLGLEKEKAVKKILSFFQICFQLIQGAIACVLGFANEETLEEIYYTWIECED